MIYVQNLLGYSVKYLVEVFIMYSVFQAAGYILTAVALAQVPLWALYEIYKTPAKGFTNVSILENSDKCILHRVVFYRKSRVLSGPTMNGDQKIHAKNWNGSKKWLIKKLTKCWMKTLPNKVLSFTQFLNLSVLVVRS